MKDSKVGAFGVQSLILITLIQIACISQIHNQIFFVLPISLFWGRFSTLFFIDKFKYVSYKRKSTNHKKSWNGFKKESLISIIFLLVFFLYHLIFFKTEETFIKNLLLLLIGLVISYKVPMTLGKKIGGFNGDACGASIVLVETSVLFMHAILL